MTQDTLIAILFLLTAGISLAAAFSSEWDFRWGGSAGRPFKERKRVSQPGKIGFGILFACFGGFWLCGARHQVIAQSLLLIYGLALFGMFLLVKWEGRKDKQRQFNPTDFEKGCAWFLMLGSVCWSVLISVFVAGWVQRGWFQYGRGKSSRIIRQLDNPVGFWTGIGFALSLATFVAGLGTYNLYRHLRKPW